MTFEDELRAYRIAILVAMQKSAAEETRLIEATVSLLNDKVAGGSPTTDDIGEALSETERLLGVLSYRTAVLRLVGEALATLQTGRVL